MLPGLHLGTTRPACIQLLGMWHTGLLLPSSLPYSVKDWERREALERIGVGSVFGDATEGGSRDVANFARILLLCTKVRGVCSKQQSSCLTGCIGMMHAGMRWVSRRC